MQTFSNYLGDDHQHCDTLFAIAEQAASDGKPDANEAHASFITAMNHHFSMEENELFPAFESASGHTTGPTAVMRHEHQQMRQLFAEMTTALAENRIEDYLGMASTLLILMQQHNAKEEQILYPMTDRVLADQRDAILTRMGQQ